MFRRAGAESSKEFFSIFFSDSETVSFSITLSYIYPHCVPRVSILSIMVLAYERLITFLHHLEALRIYAVNIFYPK